MSTFENWAQDKLSVFLGFDSNTIRSQVWPYVMATKTPEAFCERLMDMVGTNEEALAFIEEFTNRRFYPEKIQNTTPASLPPTHSSKPLKELFPDLPSTQFNQETLWPANFNVHNKKEEEYIASLKKAKKKTKATSNNELRAAAILTDKPKQEKKKKKEMSLETAFKELNIQSDTKKRKPCSCQATKHPLLTVAPNCLNCGKIICIAEGVGPCMFCGSPVISEEQEASLIAEAKKKRAEQNLPQKREELPNQSVGYASRVNGDLFSQYYVFDPNRMKLDQNKSNQESNVRKVMVIDNQSKKVRMESIEAPSSSEDDDDDDDDDEEQYSSQHAPKQGGDGTFAGFYAYNPLLKDKAKPKFIKKKVKSKTKKNESKAQTA